MVAFSPDGTKVATGSEDGTARVFDLATGTEIARLDHRAAVHSVAFSPDSTQIATGSRDGAARVFGATTDLLLQRAFGVMTRPLKNQELKRYLLSSNCKHVEQWNRLKQRAITAHPTIPQIRQI